jgi:hypothetical protein
MDGIDGMGISLSAPAVVASMRDAGPGNSSLRYR